MVVPIEADVTYDHDRLGEVLVVGVGTMYDEWNPDADQQAQSPRETLVFFYTQFDGYGGMNPAPMTEPVNEFARDAERISTHEYVGSDLREQ